MSEPVGRPRMAVAIGIVVALAGGLVWQSIGPQPGDGSTASAPALVVQSTVTTLPGPPSTLSPTTTVPAPTTSSASVPSSVIPLENPDDEMRQSIEQALTAWGAFAGSGDLDSMVPFFFEDGPQWESLVAEADSFVGGEPLEVTGDERSLTFNDASGVYRATVTFAGPGVEPVVVNWAIELRRDADGSWKIWSVLDDT